MRVKQTIERVEQLADRADELGYEVTQTARAAQYAIGAFVGLCLIWGVMAGLKIAKEMRGA